jgi:hypothetical protein
VPTRRWNEWRDADREPTDNNRALEAAFIEDHFVYGALIHQETAKALVAALAEPSERSVGHTLFLRLFAEYANALESLGAWGWTIRRRAKFKLFMDGFLAYPHSAPGDFFRWVEQEPEGDRLDSLIALLDLPEREVLLDAMDVDWLAWTRDETRSVLEMTMFNLRQSASQYFVADQIILTQYNKAKHGATMVRTPGLTEREFQVIAPHLRIKDENDDARYDITKFEVSGTLVERTRSNIEVVGGSIRILAAITRALLEAGLLYSPDERK